MSPILDEVRAFVDFTEQDAEHLRAVATLVEPELPHVLERLFAEITRHPAGRVLLHNEAQAGTLGRATLDWLRDLFRPRFDAEHARAQSRIGRAHVEIGLPQHLMVAALALVRHELHLAIGRLPRVDHAATVLALDKLLTIQTSLLLESYRESTLNQVRTVEREALQARLQKAEQLAHVGQIAASLAHEIKNPLAGISGAIQVIRAGLTESDPHWPVLGEVMRQIQRLDRTVTDLLVYARPKPPQRWDCDLRRVIERVLTLLRKEPEFAHVRFEYSLAPDLPLVPADENQMEQLLMNLLLNAAQATHSGEGLVRLEVNTRGAGVHLVVEDDGCGMAEEVARRALEPFFTTKSRGTGLGLPICRGIVEAHGGKLTFETAAGEGTRVIVELPAAEVESAEGAA